MKALVKKASENMFTSHLAEYNNNQMSFKHPDSWDIIREGVNWVQFKTSNGEVRVWLYSKDSGQLSSFKFTDNKTIGNKKYTRHVTGVNKGLRSYAFRGNNSDLFIIASKGNDKGVKQIIKSIQFK